MMKEFLQAIYTFEVEEEKISKTFTLYRDVSLLYSPEVVVVYCRVEVQFNFFAQFSV